MGAGRKARNPVQGMVWWVKKQPPKVKAFLGVVLGIVLLVFLRFVVRDHDNLLVRRLSMLSALPSSSTSS